MPPIRSSAFKHCVLLISSITFNGEIMSPYSCCIKKELVYIAITEPSNCQSSFYFKCTKSNTYMLYNVRLMPLNKYIFLTCFASL